MSSFILRKIDPDFWARVQAKAKTEGVTVKAKILELLAAWLGAALLVAGAFTLVGCSDMQMTPVAPSATSPAGATSPQPAVTPATSYTVSLSANGSGSVGTWQSTLTISAPFGATPPASVTLSCGNGTPTQFLPGLLGVQIIACAFTAPGDYTVTASAIAPNAVTTSSSIVVPVLPPPPPPQLPAQAITINAQRIGGSSTSAEWRFILQAATADQWAGIGWSFGDDTGSASDRTVEQHVYTKAGKYTVRVTAHSTVRNADFVGTREIEVKF